MRYLKTVINWLSFFTKNAMSKLLVLIVLAALCSINLMSQYRSPNDRTNYYNLGKKFYAEVHLLPCEAKDSILALTLFRFSYDMLSFEKSGILNNNVNDFFSYPKVEVEYKDTEGIIRHKELWQDTIVTSSFETTISKSDFVNAALQSRLALNKYETVEIRLSDKNIQLIKKITLKDTVKEFYFQPTIAKPLFVEFKNTEKKIFAPYILKNRIDFSNKPSGMLIPVTYKSSFSKFDYICKFTGANKKNEFKWSSDFTQSGSIIPAANSMIDVSKNEITVVELRYKTFTNSQSINDTANLLFGLLEIHLPVEEIVPGEYILHIVESQSTDTLKYFFEVVWEDMPVILQRPKFAIESMYYILNDEEYKKMLGAKEENYSQEIINYWKKEDPSKFTPYNESMAEYFKRVDYAMFNFKTLNEQNGVKTDRGKIYILYGPPTNTERTLSENKAFEIWKYEHLKKIFVFETLAKDVFKLVDIRNF